MNVLKTAASRIEPMKAWEPIRQGSNLRSFVWSASGFHQFYVGAVALGVSLLNFVPIELQRRIVDEAVGHRDIRKLAVLGCFYLSVLLAYSCLKFVLMIYQGWVGESATKAARDQLAGVASHRHGRPVEAGGQTANVIGNEIDSVGGFVGTSISEFVVNVSMTVVVFTYITYMEPVVALFSAGALVPQFIIARYLQQSLNKLVERQIMLVRKLGD